MGCFRFYWVFEALRKRISLEARSNFFGRSSEGSKITEYGTAQREDAFEDSTKSANR